MTQANINEYPVIQYKPEFHQAQIQHWITQWGMDETVVEFLPTTGFIIEGLAAIFIYETNSLVCYIEGFISNRNIKISDAVLNRLGQTAIDAAKEKGFKRMIAITELPVVAERAVGLGFKKQSKQDLLQRKL